jgi:HEAT repeat protein
MWNNRRVRKHWKFLVVLAGLALAIALIINLCGEAEPIYKSRSLTLWCLQYQAHRGRQDGPFALEENEAREAIRAIGTNGIPAALRILRAEISSRAKLAGQVRRIPRLERFAAEVVYPSQPFEPLFYFQALGEQGSPAVPELSRLLNEYTNFTQVQRYSWCLAAIGKPALPTLLAALSRPELDYRDQITAWLASDVFDFGTNINQAAPILVKLCHDPNPMVAIQSVKALGRMTTDTELLLPTLTNALKHPHAVVRAEAALIIGRLPGSKSTAVPALRAALTDPAARQEAMNALRTIAPEVLTNAAPPQ